MTKITLNVGCGNRVYKEYPNGYNCINIDIRKDLPGIDVVSDVTKLTFTDAYCDYVLASDILEHFPISRTRDILKEWGRVLKVGGCIEIRCPNLKHICQAYLNGQHNTQRTSNLLYGGQDYEFNFHYVGFDRLWITSILDECGFEVIKYDEIGNNMNIVARKLI